MESINKRLSAIEKSISSLFNSLKKIEDSKKKSDLKNFSINQLIKWLKDNEVEYQEDMKDNLIDIVWKNLNEWEWEYYDESEDQEDESEDQEDEPEEDISSGISGTSKSSSIKD
jgi:adenine C2-methylase RlmN of 23S rRNA A2503 and tRNA A37